MNLTQHTFGKAPAARYLVDLLNRLDSKRLSQKIATRLNQITTLISEIEKSNEAGTLSIHTANSMSFMLEVKIEELTQALKKSPVEGVDGDSLELCSNLMQNIMMGRVKALRHRGKKAKELEKIEIKGLTHGRIPKKVKLSDVIE